MLNAVGNTQGDEEISSLFVNKYTKLYNSVSYDAKDMYVVRQESESDIETSCEKGNCSSLHNITADR